MHLDELSVESGKKTTFLFRNAVNVTKQGAFPMTPLEPAGHLAAVGIGAPLIRPGRELARIRVTSGLRPGCGHRSVVCGYRPNLGSYMLDKRERPYLLPPDRAAPHPVVDGKVYDHRAVPTMSPRSVASTLTVWRHEVESPGGERLGIVFRDFRERQKVIQQSADARHRGVVDRFQEPFVLSVFRFRRTVVPGRFRHRRILRFSRS